MILANELRDGVGQLNFRLVKGVGRHIRLGISATVESNPETWNMELAIYSGKSLQRTVILSTASNGQIEASQTSIDLVFPADCVNGFVDGCYQWDMRVTINGVSDQFIKGTVDIGTV